MRTPSSEINLLFTSVGRRVQLLRAFRRAYEGLGLSGRLIGTDMNRLAPALGVVDRPYVVPPSSDPEYPMVLAEICRRECATLVFPLIDPDIPVLAREWATIKRTGAQVVVLSEEATRTTEDKWLTTQFFRRIGLGAPRSWLPEQLDVDRLPFPLFIRPRNGSASMNAFKVNNAHELRFFAQYVPSPIIQEFVAGEEISSDVICDPAGNLLGIVSRQRLEVRGGEVSKGVTIHNERIMEACSAIARSLPAVGPITVQCRMRDDIPLFTEINARYGGGAPLGIAAGVDSPRWLLAWAAGMNIEIPPLGRYQTGLYLSRFDDSFYLSEADCAQRASHCV
jgi:carbamoyl-phosphate synthase large subunit